MGTAFVGAVRAGSDETAWCVAALEALSPDDAERVTKLIQGRVIDNRDDSAVESVRAVMALRESRHRREAEAMAGVFGV